MAISIRYEQAAFGFLLASPHTPFIRWGELVAAIKNGAVVLDPKGVECYLFSLGSVPYQFTLDADWLHFHPGTGVESDYTWLNNCPIKVDELPSFNEITGALANDELGELLDDIGGCHPFQLLDTDREEPASHD